MSLLLLQCILLFVAVRVFANACAFLACDCCGVCNACATSCVLLMMLLLTQLMMLEIVWV